MLWAGILVLALTIFVSGVTLRSASSFDNAHLVGGAGSLENAGLPWRIKREGQYVAGFDGNVVV
jgi:hypothetical protein